MSVVGRCVCMHVCMFGIVLCFWHSPLFWHIVLCSVLKLSGFKMVRGAGESDEELRRRHVTLVLSSA